MAFVLYAATAVLILWLVHRFVSPLSPAAAIVIAVLPLGITGYALITDSVYGPIDFAYQSEPLAALKEQFGIGFAHNVTATDISAQFLPWRRAVQLSFQRGEWPLWNPYNHCGHLMAASLQSAPYSPFTLLAILLPAAVSFSYTAAMSLFIAALGAFLFGRELECGEGASLVAAAGWGFAAITVLYSLTPMGFATSFAPAILLATRRVVWSPGVPAAALLTTLLALSLLIGHPESLFLNVVVALGYALFELVRRGVAPWRSIATAVAAGALALSICAIQLLPFFEAMPQSGEFEYKEQVWAASERALPADRALASLATDLFPHLHVRRWVKPAFGLTGAETAAAGSIILAFAIYAVWRRRTPETWFFAILAVVCIAAGNRWAFVVDVLQSIPVFGIVHHERLNFHGALSLVVLAALGVDQMLRRQDFRAAAATLTGTLLVLSIGTFLITRTVVLASDPADWGTYKIFAELVFLALAGVVLITYRRSAPVSECGGDSHRSGTRQPELPRPVAVLRRWKAAALPPQSETLRVVALLVAAIVAQRLISERSTFKTYPAKAAYPKIAMLEPLKQIEEPFRLVGAAFALLPAANIYYGLEDPRGFEALTLGGLVHTWKLWCEYQPIWFNRVDDLTRPFLSFMNVRFAIQAEAAPIPDGWRPIARGGNAMLLENQRVIERIFVPRRVRVADETPARIADQMAAVQDFRELAWITDRDVTAHERDNGPGTITLRERRMGGEYRFDAAMQRDGWVVISDGAWKGWRAYLDGRRVRMQRANAAFLAVYIPAGRHSVRVVYWPESFVRGRAITFATLLAIALFAAVRRVRLR